MIDCKQFVFYTLCKKTRCFFTPNHESLIHLFVLISYEKVCDTMCFVSKSQTGELLVSFVIQQLCEDVVVVICDVILAS